ncbi:Diphosphomevalonate decarboxylase [Halotydeus destructor]|nr:Diphosphomevalonate decarboxylase [Halotydeus destructor]
MRSITVKAPVNIAVIKYWGKSDEKLIIPINDSLSGTLSTDDLYAMTTVAVSESFKGDRMWLNGDETDIVANKRLVNCLEQIRARSRLADSKYHIRICSRNNFPTAAGLASSAAGYACLVYALGTLFGIDDRRELSILARMGSGSAIRSIYGGFVQWIAGDKSDNSIAEQVVDHKYWPEMRVVILVVNDKEKETGSTSGMQNSVQTSPLISLRANTVVPQRMKDITEAIKKRDFHQFAMITMRDSNQFHAICQDTWPPIRYMNDISWEIVRLVHSFNDFYARNRVAYTFDAGPNACLYLLDEALPEFFTLIGQHFTTDQGAEYVRGQLPPAKTNISADLTAYVGSRGNKVHHNALKYVINTKVGDGPLVVEGESLLNDTGLPK